MKIVRFLSEKRMVARGEFFAASLLGAAMLAGGALVSLSLAGAVTFDSDLVPSAAGTLKLGVSAADWQSINNTIFFSGSNVGIGASSPGAVLEVNGGLRLNTTDSRPTCTAGIRGTFWVQQSAASVKDTAAVCVKNASDAYVWSTIY